MTEPGVPAAPAPVTMVNVWDLRANPDAIGVAAVAWKGFAGAVNGPRSIVDKQAMRLGEDDWSGDAAERYHDRRRELGKDFDGVEASVVQISDELWQVSGTLRAAQNTLDGMLARVTLAVPATVSPGQVTFTPRIPADVETITSAKKAAEDVRRKCDETLVGQAKGISTAFNPTFLDGLNAIDSDTTRLAFTAATKPAVITALASLGLRLAAMALRQAGGAADPEAAAADPEAARAHLLRVGDEYLVGAGAGDQTVTVSVDPTTGEQIVTVHHMDGREGQVFVVPHGAHITLVGGSGSDTIAVASGTTVGATLLDGRVVDAAHVVYGKDFPDPGVLKVGDTYYAYGTNAAGKNVQLLTSTDLQHWTEASDALPLLGGWARPGRTWAPEVVQLADGRFAMYYTAQSAATGHQAIGVAVAASPAGPFVDSSNKPLMSGAGDALDASPFRDTDGKLYLQWKDGRSSTMYGQQLSADGLNAIGDKAPLLTNHASWQGNVVEAPQMHVRDGKHYLVYSGNSFDSAGYSVGYAVCDGPLGPCHDAPENPILTGRGDAVAPGHSSLVQDPNGDDRLVYHAWRPDAINSEPGRVLWLDRVEWVDGRPVVRGPAG